MNFANISQLNRILKDFQVFCGRKLSDLEVDRFLHFYYLVLKWNNRLHLTTITQPLPFAQRHLCESVFAEDYLLPTIQKVWDIGSGVGIPGIPFSIIRPDLIITLVEANKKKAIFLKEVITSLQLN